MRYLCVTLLPLLVVACDQQAVAPDLADDPQFQAIGPVVQSVTGSGNFVIPGVRLRIFTDAAHLRADGSISGQWERNGIAHGVVTCFTIVGNEAWLAGYATSGARSTPPNNGVAWRVVDNGQGENDPADEISFQWVGAWPGFAEEWCANTPGPNDPFGLSTRPIQAGNISVRP
jgi:hypothetical protein